MDDQSHAADLPAAIPEALLSLGALFSAQTVQGQSVLLVVGDEALAVLHEETPHNVEVVPLGEVRRFEIDDSRLTLWRASGRQAFTVGDPVALVQDLTSLGVTVAGATDATPVSHASHGRATARQLLVLADAPEQERAALLTANAPARTTWFERQRRSNLRETSQLIPVVTSPDYPGHAVTAVRGPVTASTSVACGDPGTTPPGVEHATNTAIERLRLLAAEIGANTITGLSITLTPAADEILVQALGTAMTTSPMQAAAAPTARGGALRLGPDRITTLPELPGQTIVRTLGLVTSLQAASGFTAGVKGRDALDKVMSELGAQARSRGANAVIGVTASTFGAGGGITNALGGDAVGVLLVGTAALVEPLVAA